MLPRRSSLLWPVSAGVLLVAACSGGGGASSPTPAHTSTPTTSPTPSPTPLPPDRMTVGVLALGLGTFDLAAIPVAVLKNEAVFHGAASVVAHFVTHRSSRTLGSLEAVPVDLAPGETLAVTADCTDACNGATSVTVTLTVGSWPTSIGAVFATAAGAYSCQPCRSGHGYGDVKGTLTPSEPVASGTAVVGFAACRNRAGAIIGGGSEQFVWQGGGSFAVNVPVVVSAPPATCSLGASTGW